MEWFGPTWGAPVCDLVDHCATPVEEICAGCEKPFELGDQGLRLPYALSREGERWVYYHLDCFLAEVGATLPGVRGYERGLSSNSN